MPMTPEELESRRRFEFEANTDTYKQLGLYGLKAMFVCNGAAVIGLMTFLGNLWGKAGSIPPNTASAFQYAAICFIGGLSADLFAILFGWISALISIEEAHLLLETPDAAKGMINKMKKVRKAAVWSLVFSFVFFVAGSIEAIYGFPTATTN